jgi:integrase
MRKMKLPQGVGQVYKLKGTRRNPYIVRKTIGFAEVNGKRKQIIKTIGYAKTYQDGFNMLMSYNSDLVKNPNETKVVVTPECKYKFKDIFDKWSKDFFPTTSKSTMHGYTAAFKGFVGIHNKLFATLKTGDYERIIADSGKNYSTIRKMKFLLNMLYKFALKNEYVDKNYAELVDISKYSKKNPNKRDREKFSKEDINKIWAMPESDSKTITIMLLYTGTRVSELLDLEKKDLNLKERYFNVVERKTAAGIRVVPICKKLYPYFESWMNRNDNELLIENKNHNPLLYRFIRDNY